MIDDYAGAAECQGYRENDLCEQIVLNAQRVAADGGGNNGGDSGKSCNTEPG